MECRNTEIKRERERDIQIDSYNQIDEKKNRKLINKMKKETNRRQRKQRKTQSHQNSRSKTRKTNRQTQQTKDDKQRTNKTFLNDMPISHRSEILMSNQRRAPTRTRAIYLLKAQRAFMLISLGYTWTKD